MSLNDPFFTKFDGSPDLGRVPVRLIVNGTGALTPSQMLGVEHAYHQFRSAYRLSVADFHTERIRLNDGTVVWLWSLQGHDEVTVWPGPDGEEGKLPHGFAVATNWQGPLLYCRDLNDGVQWLLGPPAPQISGHTASHYDNQAFRKDVEANEFFNVPHVRDHWDTVLWDYKMNGAPSVSETPVVPFLLKNTTTGIFTFESPHYAAGGKLLDASGATLYTMADESPILTPAETTHQHPGITDASGNQVALQAMRYAVISPTYNIWLFKFWNERLNRTDDSTYTLIERSATQVTTPWGKQTTTTTSINDNSLGEDPALLFKFKGTFDRVAGATNGFIGLTGWPTHLFNTGWAGVSGITDISGINLRGYDNQSLRQIKEQTTGISTLDKLVATAGATDTGYIPIELRLNYPVNVFWRGGHSKKWYYPEDLVSLLGLPFGTSLGYHYRVDDVDITRYDTKYDVDGTPTITAKLGWTDLRLLEGSTTGRMSGKEYTNQLHQFGLYPFIDGDWTNRYIMKSTLRPADFSPMEGFYDHLYNNNSNAEYWADYLAYGTQGYLGGPAPQPAYKYEYPFNERPYNTVSYALKSRYVTDFDQKGRFYAAIRCEVTATGAAWKEDITVYKGFMVEDTDPTYTVKIWFECGWGGEPFGTPATGPTELLLVEETITRPMFEAITVSQFSPWYWPYPAYLDRDCKVRTPPEPVPDENFMMMFKNLASHQGVNPNLCCADVRPDITGIDTEESYSKDGVEYSYEDNGTVTPHTKYVTGQLYARSFKLSDFYEAFWMLRQLKCNAIQDNYQPEWEPTRPEWHYHPDIKAAMDVTRHIEVRDGVIVQWSDNIPTPISGYPPTPEAHPEPPGRTIKLYRV